MPDVVSTVGSAIGLASKLWKLAEATKDVELRSAIVDLRAELVSIKEQVVELTEERNHLRNELKTQMSLKPELQVRGDLYFKADGDGPFCTACFDSRQSLVRVTPMPQLMEDIGKFRCNACRGHYQGGE